MPADFETALAVCRAQIERESPEAEEVAEFIFTHPEPSGFEVKALEVLKDYLTRKGFRLSVPLSSLPTAFIASALLVDRPVIAFLAEYDALPGFGPQMDSFAHACGHHWITGAAITAAAALLKTIQQLRLRAQVKVIGCPDEELRGGKIAMLESGFFRGIDLCLESHLGASNEVGYQGKFRQSLDIRFFGKQTHGSGSHLRGANALSTLIRFLYNLEQQKPSFDPDVEISWIISQGGKQANVTPRYAEAKLMVRADSSEVLDQAILRIRRLAEKLSFVPLTLQICVGGTPYLPVKCFPSLLSLAQEAMAAADVPNAIINDDDQIGSTDLGNLSQLIPTIYTILSIDGPEGSYLHEEEILSYMLTETIFEKMRLAAYVMCYSALKVIFYPDLLRKIWLEHA